MTQELKYAVRGLTRAPFYSAVIVVTLALAIGATTTIYSVVNGVLLRPLPFPDQHRLVMLWQRAPGVGVTEDWFSAAQYFDIRESTASLEHVAVTFGQEVTLTGDEIEPTRLGAMRVSSSFFDVIGITPLHGRRFDATDDIADAPRKVLLGHRLYTQWFGANPSIVGESVTIDGQRLEIVGVMPPGFDIEENQVQVWAPHGLGAADIGRRATTSCFPFPVQRSTRPSSRPPPARRALLAVAPVPPPALPRPASSATPATSFPALARRPPPAACPAAAPA